MANRHKWLVTLITWPVLSKYGYFKDQELKERISITGGKLALAFGIVVAMACRLRTLKS